MNYSPKMMLHIAPHQSVPNSYDMYIYDDVAARGKFDWETWTEMESETSAKYFRDKLSEIPADAVINLYINSNGGEVKEGVGIYNQLKRHGAKVNVIVDGNAYSVAFLILMACDHKTMNLGTSALVHNMWTIVAGNAKTLRKEADDLDKLMESNRQIFLEASGGKITEEKLIELMDAETFLTPDECLEYGFIDEVNRQQEEDPEDPEEDPTEDPEDPDDDDQEELKQLRADVVRMKAQIEDLQQKVRKEEPAPAEPMSKETVNSLVTKFFN